MPQNAVLVQTDDFKSVLACSRAFGGVFGDHPNSRFRTGFGVTEALVAPGFLVRLFLCSPQVPPNDLEPAPVDLKSSVCPSTAV